MERFDEVAAMVRTALAEGRPDTDPDVDVEALTGLRVLDLDVPRARIVAEISQADWLRSEGQRRLSLHSANVARLAGWRLRRRLST